MTHSPTGAGPAILLVDNGSLEPGAVMSLRSIAGRLGAALGRPVEPLSLLHSSAVPAESLGGRPAEILETGLERRLRAGACDFVVMPLFFGPSSALADYLPRRVAALKERYPRLRLRLASPLFDTADPGDTRLAAILEDRVRAAMPRGGRPPAVILVDHGSPVRAVVAVRDLLVGQLRARLGAAVSSVIAASMERRPGPEFSFGDPLIEKALDAPGCSEGTVIVAHLFFSPGRHAGPGGDIARICAAAEGRHKGLRIIPTELVGSHAGLVPILVDRLRAGLESEPL